MKGPLAASLAFAFALAALVTPTIGAQARPRPSGGTTISGRVTDVLGGRPLADVTVSVEGTALVARSDSLGRYRIGSVPAGPQVLETRRFGYAPARVLVNAPQSGTVSRDIEIARTALQMRDIRVSADVVSRARGELGTATVVTREAISNLGTPSLAGIIELLPGVPLAAPGLDNTQQISLRAVPTFSGNVERLAAFGTLIILDGVPVSNNANLQSTGPRGEIATTTNAGGGIDLRRIPAATLERVEVIRGVPSSRYGDLTQGAVIIDTRAGVIAPEVLGRYDPRTSELNVAGGWGVTLAQNASLTTDLARTLLAPGIRNADVWRGTVDLAHRLTFSEKRSRSLEGAGSVIDSRLSVHQLYENSPEEPDVRPGRLSSNRSGGARLSQRARWGPLAGNHLEVTTSIDRGWQNTRDQRVLIRGAEPFTDRLTPGRSTGRYVGGAYPAAAHLLGTPWHVYTRWEGVLPATPLGGFNTLRGGTELRREWNAGPGYQFDIEFPPQVGFNGVNGYDRPRRYDAIPALATTAVYLDDRFVASLPLGVGVEIQGGLRADVLHRGTWWTWGARDVMLQPRVNAQLAPRTWLRLRGGWGSTAKVPTLGDLHPAPQYYDVVNVNWYPPDSAERLAVLTTSVRDPTNTALRFARGHKLEAGLELDLGHSGAAMSLVGFRDLTVGGVGYDRQPTFLLREHFALTDSTTGTGRPPDYIVPAQAIDTVPVFIDRPRNLQRIDNRGLELTLSLPEMAAIQTKMELQGAWTVSRFSNDAVDFGAPNRVSDFQLDSLRKRVPYWLGNIERGERALVTARLIHHQPELGLVVTGTVQHFLRENTVQEDATDTLAWAGYVTRAGDLVPVPVDRRLDQQFSDLRQRRFGLVTVRQSPPPDWMLNVQVAKTIFGQGRLAFYSFNAFDRLGKPATNLRAARLFPRVRFGLELSVPTAALRRTR